MSRAARANICHMSTARPPVERALTNLASAAVLFGGAAWWTRRKSTAEQGALAEEAVATEEAGNGPGAVASALHGAVRGPGTPAAVSSVPAPPAAAMGVADQLESLFRLKAVGALSEEEFEAAKAKVLAGGPN